jgi:hypothetical protein
MRDVHGQAERSSLTMVWSNLPPDVEEAILGLLSLVDLSRISRTCHSFHASFCRRMADLQSARCDLALSWFGPNRITCIAGLVTSFVNGEPMDRNLPWHGANVFEISLDGALHVNARHAARPITSATVQAGDCRVELFTRSGTGLRSWMLVHVYTAGGGFTKIRVDFGEPTNVLIIISVTPCDAEDVMGVALIQALLSQDLAPGFCDAVSHAQVSIEANFEYARMVFSSVTLDSHREAQILPILPLIAQHGNWRLGWWGHGYRSKGFRRDADVFSGWTMSSARMTGPTFQLCAARHSLLGKP